MRITRSFVFALAMTAGGCSRQAPPSAEEQSERDRELEAMMTNVSFVGQSTIFGREGISGKEEYVIEKVSRVAGDQWLFHTTMKLGSGDVSVPIPITILWAGDTPVITLTDLSIPGMGSYSARVLLYRDHYAGTWLGAEGGGHVFGDIVRRQD
ncbi:MAG TPA: hypothetical protein VJ921_01915 [Vicinamibacteria bacterium]|nr:hypothetical protein [Vicinamibacteria bacterium]